MKYDKERYEKNKEEAIRRQREWQKYNPDKFLKYRTEYLRKIHEALVEKWKTHACLDCKIPMPGVWFKIKRCPKCAKEKYVLDHRKASNKYNRKMGYYK